MDKTDQFLTTLGDLYESIVDESLWPRALRSLSDFAGGCGTFYVRADPRNGVIVHSESVDVDPVASKRYLEYYATKEVRLAPALALPVGQLATEGMLIDRRVLERSELYADLLLPFDIPNILMLWVEKKPSLCSAIVVERSSRQGTFLSDECQVFSRLVPHLMRALTVRNELQGLRERQRLQLETIYRLPFTIIFLDRTERIVESSPAAQALLRTGQGLTQKAGRLRAMFPDDDRRLQQAVFRATASGRENGALGDTMAIRRQNGKRPLSVVVIPMRSPDRLAMSKAICMLVIFDPEASPQPAVAIVKKMLRLTDAEALLACTLFTGITLAEAAQHLDLSINTCKTQLKSIYAKTGCRSHVDLAKMLLMTSITN